MKRLVVVSCSLLFLANEAGAQFYVQTVTPGAYVPLVSIPGAQNITAFTFSSVDEGSAIVPIPFTFTYLGQPYAEARVAVNGYVVFGANTDFGSYTNYPIGSPNGADNVIAVWWDDLIIPAISGYASYGTIGVAPNRIFVIEVREWEAYGLDSISDGNWQVWLYEGSAGRFEVRVDGELDATEGYSATSGWEGANGVPFGAFVSCSNGDPYCDHLDYATMRGNIYGVEQAQGPELLGAAGVFPRGALPGQSANGQVTLRNVGTQAVTNVQSELRLSLDAQADLNDIVVSTFTVPQLQAGNVPVTLTATVNVPGNAPPGDYFLLLVVDSNGTVTEVSESNNVAPAAARFATAYDLQALDAIAIDGANQGQTLSLDVQIGNQGVLYAGAVTVRVFGSLNSIFDANDPVIGTASINLGGSPIEALTVPLTLPAIPTGSYYPVLRIDPNDNLLEYDEADNTIVGSQPFPVGPELIVSQLVSPGGADPGQPITFTVTVQNDGVRYSGPAEIRFIASPDPIFDVNDPVLGTTTITLTGLVLETLPATITMPPLPAGVYYPIAQLDPNDLIDEGNDFNNTAVSVDVFTSGPDFTVAEIDGPTQATPGLAMDVTTTIGSAGAPFTGAVRYRLYLSADRNYDGQDVMVGDYTVNFTGQAAIADARMPLFPATLPPTGHYLIGIVDPLANQAEADEGNNLFIDDQRIGSGTDFTIYSVDFTPSSARVGDQVIIDFTLYAEGTPYTGQVGYSISMSLDSSPDPTDIRVLDGSVAVDGEGAYSVTATLTIDLGIPPGAYEFIVAADPNDLVIEPSETNNWDNSFFDIDIEGPNLMVSRFIAGPQAFVGFPYQVELTITNADVGDAASFRYGYYYTTNGLLRPPDGIELHTVNAAAIPAGGSLTLTDMIDIPPQSVPSRFVQFGVILDLDQDVTESDEADNVTFLPGQVQILDPVSDLWARIDESSLEAGAGEDLAVTRTLQNLGVADSPPFTYAYYLSANAEISPVDDILIESLPGQLALGEYDRSIDIVNLPATTPPGLYYLGLVADPGDLLLETDETNNVALGPEIRVHPAGLLVATGELPAAVLGAPYSVELFASGPLAGRQWSIAGGTLPPGLALDQLTGTISGTPTEDGLYPFTARVTVGTAYAERELALRVRGATVPLEILSLMLPYAIAGRPYQTELIAVGGANPYTWGVRSTLPPGLTATSTGGIGGIPTQSGVYTLAVVVTDALGDAQIADVALNVINADQTLTVTPAPLPQAVLDQEYCDLQPIRLYASGGFPPYRWSWLDQLPPGMMLSPEGELCGVPSQAGDFQVLARAEDSAGVFDTSLFILRVRSESELAITVTTLQDAFVGEAYLAKLTARQGVDPYRWRIYDGLLPAGLELMEDGTIAGAPTQVETAVFVVEVVDGAMQARLQPLSLHVTDAAGEGCGCSAARSGQRAPIGLLLLLGSMIGRLRRKRPVLGRAVVE